MADKFNDINNQSSDSDIPRAEVAEILPPTDWQWREVRPVYPVQRRRRRLLPLMLFVATCITTTSVGGLWYSVPVMTILLCHEMGHFIQTRRYGVHASFPFFIPVPLPPLGTMGAVIAMDPRVGHRRALFDIGITGPLAGLVPTLIFLVVGLHYSQFTPVTIHAGEQFDANQTFLGAPLLFRFLTSYILGPVPDGYILVIHKMAFAAWVGLLITSLNLFPIGQLDGGHILYALLPGRSQKVSAMLLLGGLLAVILFWDWLWQWSVMLGLLFFIGPIHPPTANDEEPLGLWRQILGWLTLAFIVVGFTPIPFPTG